MTLRFSLPGRFALALPVALLLAALAFVVAAPAFAQEPPPPPSADPSGTKTGGPENLGSVVVNGTTLSPDDYKAALEKAKTDNPLVYDLAAHIDQERLAINMV